MTLTLLTSDQAIKTSVVQSDIMISPNLSSVAAGAASPARISPAASPEDREPEVTEAEKEEKALKLTNFSIAALINKNNDDELERRKRFLQSMPMLGKLNEFRVAR